MTESKHTDRIRRILGIRKDFAPLGSALEIAPILDAMEQERNELIAALQKSSKSRKHWPKKSNTKTTRAGLEKRQRKDSRASTTPENQP